MLERFTDDARGVVTGAQGHCARRQEGTC